ncbi:short-chain dehydrogenase/reductase 2 [Truncatella angustata]|uniref:Short-chain dehydrogenase/reductase 3 n=1 Tax=Truncatella angustata TaxID=152316 RepID=A0A9P8UH41_9PEZI|nr:short-chain dehydrogenase/reductase 2 [Truncatella angustata]KAH6652003.1 short-chain dehydrogenase/reductase 2 [Truncatella angustata]KAH8205723.1 hypothetical protein TruAng_000217 [Truncatella angustata]
MAVSLPYFTGLFLAIVKYLPKQQQSRLDAILAKYGTDTRLVVKAAWVLFAFGIVRSLNQFLNTWAMNHWRLSAHKGWDWSEEVAVVTGGASGIGEKTVLGLVRKGVKVAILDVQPPLHDLNVEGLRYYDCDITSPESVHRAASALRSDLGHPSILINNAGIQISKPILSTDIDSVRKVFEVNTISHWITVNEFIPHMIKLNKGHIVTIASLASFVALPSGADYSASKASALAFHESLSTELKNIHKTPGVITSVVHPSFVQTPLIENLSGQLKAAGVVLLSSELVAYKILDQIFKRKGGQIIIPERVSIISTLRAWPNWMQELFRDRFGRATSR